AVLKAFSGQPDQLAGMPTVLAAADMLEEAASVVVAGTPSDPAAGALVSTALRTPDPAIVVSRAARSDSLPAGHPAHGKTAGPECPVAYVCRRAVCGLPVGSPAALAQALSRRG
ncbi:MAG: thioredoxin domain-containing protein, partial [Rhodopila sp.]